MGCLAEFVRLAVRDRLPNAPSELDDCSEKHRNANLDGNRLSPNDSLQGLRTVDGWRGGEAAIVTVVPAIAPRTR